jgi:hypothetical protein
MNTEERAKYILMQCYEWQNEVNCYGITPQKTTAPDYLNAKKRALKQTKNFSDQSIYLYILNNL